MIRRWVVRTLIICAAPFIAMVEADAQTFDGITIIELADKAGWEAITGYNRSRGGIGDAQYLLTFVSARGTYATLTSFRGGSGCVAWAKPGSYTGSSVTFGIPADSYAREDFHGLCQPFTLRFESPGEVRVEANNKVGGYSGPQSADARPVRYSRRRSVVTQIPLVALDWGLAPFARHDIKGVRLGPVPALMEAGSIAAKMEISRLRNMPGNPYKQLTVRLGKQPGSSLSATVNGSIAVAEVTGWPWDVLYGAMYSERLPQQSSREEFEQAVIDRYGQPSLRFTQKRRSKEILLWLYDLNGKQLGPDDAAPGNCLVTWNLKLWGTTGMAQNNRDIGPWGCALVMVLTHDGMKSLMSDGELMDRNVSEYRIEAISGYALALNHFLTRIESMRQIQEKIGTLQAYQPKL